MPQSFGKKVTSWLLSNIRWTAALYDSDFLTNPLERRLRSEQRTLFSITVNEVTVMIPLVSIVEIESAQTTTMSRTSCSQDKRTLDPMLAVMQRDQYVKVCLLSRSRTRTIVIAELTLSYPVCNVGWCLSCNGCNLLWNMRPSAKGPSNSPLSTIS